jgi:hypothetical protein
MFSNRVRNSGIFAAAFTAVFFSSVTPSLAQQKLTMGEVKYFKDWAVGCDNTVSCQAVAMKPLENFEGYLTLTVLRDSIKDRSPIIEITGMDADVSMYKIFIDKRLVSSGELKGVNDSISISSKDTSKILRAIPNGKMLSVTDATGKEVGRVSLSGSAAALRYLNAKQKPSLKRPLPIITAKRISKEDLIPETGDLVALAESSKCIAERQGVTEDTAYSLGNHGGKAKALALISCGNGAYNFSSIAFVGTRGADGKWKFEAAQFDRSSATNASVNEERILTNAEWNPANQQLSSYHKGRGIADCGYTDDFVWDGSMFRLTRAERMDECQGSLVWIPVWRAGVKFIS